MAVVERVEVVDSVEAPRRPAAGRLRDFYFPATERLTLGLVRYRDHSFAIGPVTLIRFGEPMATETGWRFPIGPGALVADPGGELTIDWRAGRLEAVVRGYRPSLPMPLYRWTQLLFHHFQTRLVLLQMRGRLPAEAVPATPAARLAAGAVDAALCLGLARCRARRALLLAAVYHVVCWRLNGVTLGGLLLRQRVTAVDGSGLTAGQALLRLACLPLAAFRLRAIHDDVAGTEVVRP
ncbi:MAG TPA: RDD family protein [Candidatus Dormibacteraeota bacterium]|nr:RDD family protein [Candidatus Dormibacteraeota bacterium]